MKPGQLYFAVYVIGVVCTFGALWLVKNMIQHAIHDAMQPEKVRK